MAFAQLTWRDSLRDVGICLQANQSKLFHMGISQVPRRSTLSDALNARNWRIYHGLAMKLMIKAKKLYVDEQPIPGVDGPIYAMDSSTIDLCLNLFDWALFRRTKAAIKLHTVLDLRGNIPVFIHISNGKVADVKVLDILPIESKAFYVMDRGYVDFARFYRIDQQGAFFVTRAKKSMSFVRVYSAKVDRSTGIMCDQTIKLTGHCRAKDYPKHLRRIRYKDAQTGKTLIFITNNTKLSPLVIALLYKNRWQVELFFKWIKQHLKIKHFLGNNENAVKTQIWCAISSYLVIAIIKKELKLEASLYTLLQILSVSIFEKTHISCALQPSDYKTTDNTQYKQLNLLEL